MALKYYPHVPLKDNCVLCNVDLNKLPEFSRQTLYIKGLPTEDPNLTKETIERWISRYGSVIAVKMQFKGRQFSGNCFVIMSNEDEASYAKRNIIDFRRHELWVGIESEIQLEKNSQGINSTSISPNTSPIVSQNLSQSMGLHTISPGSETGFETRLTQSSPNTSPTKPYDPFSIYYKPSQLCLSDMQTLRQTNLLRYEAEIKVIPREVLKEGPPHAPKFQCKVNHTIAIVNVTINLEYTTPTSRKRQHCDRFMDIYIFYEIDRQLYKRNKPPFVEISNNYIILEGQEDVHRTSLVEVHEEDDVEQLEYKSKTLRKHEFNMLVKRYDWLQGAEEIIFELWSSGKSYRNIIRKMGKKIAQKDIEAFHKILTDLNVHDTILNLHEDAMKHMDGVSSLNNEDDDDLSEENEEDKPLSPVETESIYEGNIPLSVIRAGYFDKNTFVDVWKTSCETSLGYNLSGPNIRLFFNRHFLKYQIGSLLNCITKPIQFQFNPETSHLQIFVLMDNLPTIVRKEQYNSRLTRSLDFTERGTWNLVTTLSFDISKELFDLHMNKILTVFYTLTKYGLVTISPPNSFNMKSFELGRYKVPKNIQQLDMMTRFKIQCLVSNHRVIKEYVTEEWIDLLISCGKHAFFVLSRLEKHTDRIDNLMEMTLMAYGEVKDNDVESLTLPKGYIYVIHCIVTPLRDVCIGPIAELSNRVIRKYKKFQNNFIRVSFKEENLSSSIKSIGSRAARNKILQSLEKGIYLEFLDMKFDFLAYSAGQLRGHKAWFFSPTVDEDGTRIDAAHLRDWMGDLKGIFNVARYAARLGQAFSSTYSTFNLEPTDIIRIPDIIHDGFTFSDGCGTCSRKVAEHAAEFLELSYVPSVFQIRLGGIKGVVSIDDRLEGYQICVRPSMEKFQSTFTDFEVVTWSRPLPAHLNKQLILILSSRGVSDKVFLDLQQEAILKLIAPFSENKSIDSVIEVLENTWRTKNSSESLPSRCIRLLRAGFPLHEPFVDSVLRAINVKRYKDLKELARIPISQGQYAIGIIDEYNILEPNQVFYRLSIDHEKKEYQTITGKILVSRSPGLHPGDARIVEAVDIPELRHLVDCLVFSAQGERPVFNECSGGDLDGDQYLVIWDPNLIPSVDAQSAEHNPSSVASKSNDDNEVTLREIQEFFTQYIMEDRLGQIADSHMVLADKSSLGAFDPQCLKLAEYHNIAVDAPKTGKEIPSMSAFKVSEWPDFMCMNLSLSYMSKKILGKLYRAASSDNYFIGKSGVRYESLELDPDLHVDGKEEFIEEALRLRCRYNLDLEGVMNQYALKDEATSISGDVFWNSVKERREWQSKRDGFEAALKSMRQYYYKNFMEGISEDQKFKKASAWYYVTYCKDFYEEQNSNIMISFPWIVDNVLCDMKKRTNVDNS